MMHIVVLMTANLGYILGHIMRTAQVKVIGRAMRTASFFDKTRELLVRRFYCIPILFSNIIIGVVFLKSHILLNARKWSGNKISCYTDLRSSAQ
mgnify:CR=1 FL=1